MGSRKPDKSHKPSRRNPNGGLSSRRPPAPFKKKSPKNGSGLPDEGKPKKRDNKKPKPKQKQKQSRPEGGETEQGNGGSLQPLTAAEQLKFFVDHYQSANNVQLSSLELESINETRILELPRDSKEDDDKCLEKQLKAAFGTLWKEALFEKNLVEGKVDPGSPAVLVISASAIKAIEVLRGFRSLTKECHAAKLFSKHIKVEEQVNLLKQRVNIAGGTPSRIKKLIDVEALGLSRLSVLVIDLHVDVKGYSLLTLPQVRDEFWDLYKNYFHQRLLDGNTRICLYGPIQSSAKFLHKKRGVPEE